MIGETTLDERVDRQLHRLEEVRKHYAGRFPGIEDNIIYDGKIAVLAEEQLVGQLLADAIWLATYHGINIEDLFQEVLSSVLVRFPDIC